MSMTVYLQILERVSVTIRTYKTRFYLFLRVLILESSWLTLTVRPAFGPHCSLDLCAARYCDSELLLRSSWTLCSTWAGRLQPSLLARCKWSLCFRYSVRALGLWQYGWYVVTRAWEISQAYKVVQGEVWRSCAIELDWHKNSDLGSEVGTRTSLNSTMCS